MTDNPNLSWAMPHHHRVSIPPGQTTPAEVQAAIDELGLGVPPIEPVIGQVYEFTR